MRRAWDEGPPGTKTGCVASLKIDIKTSGQPNETHNESDIGEREKEMLGTRPGRDKKRRQFPESVMSRSF